MTTFKYPFKKEIFHQKHPRLMIRTVIISDDIITNTLLLNIIQEYAPSIELIGTAINSTQGKEYIEELKPDLIFIHLNVDDDSCFEMLDTIRNPSFKIIFISQEERHALKAFKYGAVDYLLEPLVPKDILRSIERVKQTQINQAIYNRLDYLIRQNNKGGNHKITIPTSDGINVLAVSDIIRIEADRSYCFIYLTDGDRILVSKPLKELENLLKDNNFFRVHSANLINMDYVKKYSKEDGGQVILNDGSHIPIARRRKKEFFELLST